MWFCYNLISQKLFDVFRDMYVHRQEVGFRIQALRRNVISSIYGTAVNRQCVLYVG